MPQDQLNFGSIPVVKSPDTPDPSGLNFGDIPKASSFGVVNPDEDAALRQRQIATAPEVVSRGPRGMRPATGAAGTIISGLETGVNTARAIGRTVDPRTPEGRKNLAAGGAAAAMAAATEGASTLPWITRLLATPIAAAFGGSAAEAGEQIAGTKPVTSGSEVAMSGAEQGAYEIGGKMFMWPIRRGIAMFKAAPAVARQAGEKLTQNIQAARDAGVDMMDTVREKGRRFMAGETATARQGVRTAARAGGLEVGRAKDLAASDLATAQANITSNIASVRQQAAARLAEAEQQGSAQVADAQKLYDDLLADAPSTIDAGKKVRAVVQPRDIPGVPKGAAQRALDVAGARVSEAAQSGPPIAVKPIQDALDQMAAQARPSAIFANEAPKDPGIGFIQSLRARKSGESIAAGIKGGPGSNTAVDMTKLEKAIRDQLGIVDEKHPLPGILGKIVNMPADAQLSFADAHQLKKLLDESVNFDRAASKHIEQLTKGIRSTLRESLAVHEPYNEATRAFAEIVPTYRKGVGKQLIKAAQEDPDKVVRLLSAKDPARAQQIKDLLVTQAAAGGDAEAGQQAWHAVQSSWVYNNIIRGGPEKLQQRLATTLTEHPEFARIVLNDPTAHRVLSNVDRIGEAFRHAQQAAGDALLAAKTAGAAQVEQTTAAGADALTHVRANNRASVAGAQDLATSTVNRARDDAASRLTKAREAVADTTRATARTARAGVESATEKRRKFAQSSLAAFGGPNVEDQRLADLARAGVLGPKTFTGALSLIRLLTGPKNADLVEWAAYSDSNTQRLVAALQSRLPDSAVAGLMRELATVLREPHDDDARSARSTPPAQPAPSRQ